MDMKWKKFWDIKLFLISFILTIGIFIILVIGNILTDSIFLLMIPPFFFMSLGFFAFVLVDNVFNYRICTMVKLSEKQIDGIITLCKNRYGEPKKFKNDEKRFLVRYPLHRDITYYKKSNLIVINKANSYVKRMIPLIKEEYPV